MTDLSGLDCLGYLRVSTAEQAGERVTSLSDQQSAVTALAAKLGRTVGAWFRDEGASGATAEKRPAFRAMLQACETARRSVRKPGLVLVLNDSRFGRFDDPEEAAYWRVHLRRLGWLVRFVESDETEDKTARTLMRAIGSVTATAHRDAIRGNARRGIRGASEQGFWTFRTPYGYRRQVVHPAGRERVLEAGVLSAPDEKVRLVPHPAEAEIVRALFDRYASGAHSLDSLTEWLRATVPGRPWARPTVRWMLRNAVYVGDVIGGRLASLPEDRRADRAAGVVRDTYGHEAAHEPLVSRALWALVQARLAENARRRRNVRSDWLVSGVVACRCGAPFVSGGGGGRGGRLASYRCATRTRPRAERCPYGGTVLKPLLEGAVLDTVGGVLRTARARRALERALDARLAAERATPGRSPADLERQAAAVAAKRDRVVAAIGEGTMTAGEAAPVLADYRAQLAALDAEREAARERAAHTDAAGEERGAMLAMLADFPRQVEATVAAGGDVPRLRAILRPWIKSAVFDTSTRVLTVEIRHVPATGRVGPEDGTACPTARKRDPGTTVRRVPVGRRRA